MNEELCRVRLGKWIVGLLVREGRLTEESRQLAYRLFRCETVEDVEALAAARNWKVERVVWKGP